MSMHIGAKYGEIAPEVLLPGDPLRAQYIAEYYLEDAVCFNQIRGMYGYTGSYKGNRVSVMATGMGVPSLMIYATELCEEYGCKKLVRVGTSGAFREDVLMGDLVLSMATSTTSAINQYNLPGVYAPAADFELLDKAYHLAKEQDYRIHVGNTICNDHFYIKDKLEFSKKWAEYGILASEQEGAGLYTVAALQKVQALMITTIVLNLYRPQEQMSPEVKERGLDQMVTIGLETLLD